MASLRTSLAFLALFALLCVAVATPTFFYKKPYSYGFGKYKYYSHYPSYPQYQQQPYYYQYGYQQQAPQYYW